MSLRCLSVVLLLALLTLTPSVRAESEHLQLNETRILVGESSAYTPLLRVEPREMLVVAPLSVNARLAGIGDYPVEYNRTTGQRTSLKTGTVGDVQARVGLKFNTRRAFLPFNFAAEYEHDLITGPIGKEPNIEGDGLPASELLEHQLRKAYGRVSLGYVAHIIGGLMTSHWGLGLLANDGAHGWHPGSAEFSDPRGGDRVFRVALASGPITPLGLYAAVGYDWVYHDDVTLEDDDARQLIGAVMIGRDKPHTLGIYGVWRIQDAPDGDRTEVGVVDFYGKTGVHLTEHTHLQLEVETALIKGTSELASSPTYPTKDVLQLGVAARAKLSYRHVIGAVVDFLFASGDNNVDDDQQNAFKADQNFEMGLLLYKHVLAAHSGRAPFNASDPSLVGVPNEDLDRFPTRGSASNTITIFPRAWWRPTTGLEIYGGPLFAFTATDMIDPFSTRLSGGVPRNAFDAGPGRYLGTEVDVGVRFRGAVANTQLTAGLEGGVLFPGSAFRDQTNDTMDPVMGGRVIVGYKF